MPEYFIMDLDGCCSCDKWRFCKVDQSVEHKGDRYRDYNELCWQDKPANMRILEAEAQGREPIVVTARPEYVRKKTIIWICENVPFFIATKNILMRPLDDLRGSAELKKELVQRWLLENKGAIIQCAYDDRDDVLEMYKSIGILPIKLQAEEYERIPE